MEKFALGESQDRLFSCVFFIVFCEIVKKNKEGENKKVKYRIIVYEVNLGCFIICYLIVISMIR